MNHSLTIEVVDNEAMTFLKSMERMHLIKIFTKTTSGKINWAAKYKGAMCKQPIEDIDQQLNELRNAWE